MEPKDIQMVQSFASFAAKRCSIKEDAEDVMQDVFVRILCNPKFNDLGEVDKRKYVVWLIKNLVIDRYIKRNAEKNGGGKILPILYEESVGRKPDVYSKIELKEIMKKGRRHSFFPELMMSVEGYKCNEIAEFTRESLNTTLGRIRYARIFIKK